jgi:hypothetical protein
MAKKKTFSDGQFRLLKSCLDLAPNDEESVKRVLIMNIFYALNRQKQGTHNKVL